MSMSSPLSRRLPPLATAALCLAFATTSPVDAKVREGDRAAELVRVLGPDGKKISLRKLKDRVVVMTFGASWCAPCKKELPALEKLARKYAGKKVVFIAINIDSERAKGERFMKEAGLDKVVAAYDTESTSVAAYEPPSMPSTFVIRRGVVRHLHKGYRKGDDRKLDKVIATELGKLE